MLRDVIRLGTPVSSPPGVCLLPVWTSFIRMRSRERVDIKIVDCSRQCTSLQVFSMSENYVFHILNDDLLNVGAVNSPSELQGLLCGQLCGGRELSNEQWLEEAIRYLNLDDPILPASIQASLSEMHTRTRSGLQDGQYRFTLFLPEDNDSLERRTSELGLWCQGFLHGIGTSGLTGSSQLSATSAEALKDLAKITQVELDSDDEVDENEAYWIEVLEYVKVAALTLYSEMARPAATTMAGTDTKH